MPPRCLCSTFTMHFITHLSGLLTGGLFFIVQDTSCRLSLTGIFAISVNTMGSLKRPATDHNLPALISKEVLVLGLVLQV